MVGRSEPWGVGLGSVSFIRDPPRPRDGVSPGDRVPWHNDGRRGRTVPHKEPRVARRGGAADLWIFRPDDRGTSRIRPGRIPGPVASRHGGARSPPHRSRRAVRSEGACLAVFDPRHPRSDRSIAARVPGRHRNGGETRCVVAAVARSGVPGLPRHGRTVASVVSGRVAVRDLRRYARRVRSTSRPSAVGYSSTRNAGRRSVGAIFSRIQGAISRRFLGPSTPMRSRGT